MKKEKIASKMSCRNCKGKGCTSCKASLFEKADKTIKRIKEGGHDSRYDD